MGIREDLHRAHKERQKRMAMAALRHQMKDRTFNPTPVIHQAGPETRVDVAKCLPPTMAYNHVPTTVSVRFPHLTADGRIKIATIIQVVADYFGLSVLDLKSERRTLKLSRPRHIIMYLARTLTERSMPAIGLQMHRDHTSILHGVRKVERLLAEGDEAMRRDVDAITSLVKARSLVCIKSLSMVA